MYRIILVSFLLMVNIAFSMQIRTGNHPDKFRVVFDVKEKTTFEYIPFFDLNIIILSVNKDISVFNERIFKNPKVKKYIKDIDIIKSQGNTKFVIEFDRSIKGVEIFTLKNPYRIVVDFIKTDKHKKRKDSIFVRKEKPKQKKVKKVDVASIDEADRLIRQIIQSNTSTTNKVVAKRKSKKRYYSRRKKIIVIDPGHGGRDPGAVAYGLKEKDVNLRFAKTLKRILERDGRFKVYLTRNSDRFVSLYRRTLFAIKKRADLFISIHCNASPSRRGYGTYVYTLNLRGARSKLARMVEQRENRVVIDYVKVSANPYVNRIVADLAISNTMTHGLIFAKHLKKHLRKTVRFRDIDSANFAVLKTPGIPSVLIETAYITNPREARLLRSRKFIEKFSRSVYKAIVDYFF
ncbi:MAG: AMIN domain-containing protein [Aquificae bacterium]|nr:AMIN domain-containing protein [Aquificota bacterium]